MKTTFLNAIYRSLFTAISTSVSSFISNNAGAFDRSEYVYVKADKLFLLNEEPDIEIIKRFNHIRNKLRRLCGNLFSDCRITVKRVDKQDYDIILCKTSLMGNTFIDKWDILEKEITAVSSCVSPVMVTPIEMIETMQGTSGSELNNEKGSPSELINININNSKSFLACSTKVQII